MNPEGGPVLRPQRDERRPFPRVVLPADTVTIDSGQERFVLTLANWSSLRERAIAALVNFHAQVPEEPGPDIGRRRRIALPVQILEFFDRVGYTRRIPDSHVLRGDSGWRL
jgi:Elongation factor SelB, winged helix